MDIVTIGCSLLFSGKWITSLDELRKHTMYNRIGGGYKCDGYLDGLEITHLDYRKLFEQHKHNNKALFVLDPPYLSTECGMYENYWKLTDYLNVLRLLQGTKYIYFTSDKSQVVELCRFMGDLYGDTAPMYGAKVHLRTNQINLKSKYNDMMIVKL